VTHPRRLPHLRHLVLVVVLFPSPALAQHEHHTTSAAPGWSFRAAAQAFLTLNIQDREFTDFTQVESTNWLMASARRATSSTQLTFTVMASAEPFTLRRLGSAQVFQSGETLDDLPLRDYQHPHDLIMALDGRFDWSATPSTKVFVYGAIVGSPALGPTPFMHRTSAAFHPTAPLTHHMLDSTHISHGVVTAGVERRSFGLEVSAFQGREPDEDRLDLDLGPLDSVAARASWRNGPWRAQVSNGWLTSPEPLEPGDVVKTTASIEYARTHSTDARGLSWTAAVGRNRRSDHTEWGFLAEGALHITSALRLYTRAEIADRFILVDFEHAAHTGEERHFRSRIGAWLFGADREVWRSGLATAAVGADVTIHRSPANLRESYGAPVSWHVYVRLVR
jgi:hypothetical protein